MKKLLIFLLLFASVCAFTEDQKVIPQEIQENPLSSHFLSLEEFFLNFDYERDFTPTDPPTGDVRQTSEFEQMEGVLVVYPLGVPYNLIAEISEDTKVYTIVASYQQSQCENNYQNNGVNLANCEFINASTNSYWVRDFGPWFIAEDDQIAIVDFPYNRPRPFDDEIPIEVANYLGIDLYGMDIEHTGGNYMCDGNYVGASTDLVYDENPSLTPAQIEQLVLDFLGIQEYHVTLDPLDDYIKHIDCWGKFLDVDKVLIGEVPETDYRYEDFEAVADYFVAQTSAWGNNYQVYRVYTPGGNPATPYTNSLIVNNKVFVPQTGSQWDDEALQTYEQAMPGYEIFGIYSTGWLNTDALHCRTRGVADRNMLYVEHQPLWGNQEYRTEFEIMAKIIPFSDEALIMDSLQVIYQIDDGNFIAVQMTDNGNDTYSGIIPAQPIGTEVSYFIHAADESGKNVFHPFIGAADPHQFTVITGPTPAELVLDPAFFELEMSVDETLTEELQMKNIGETTLTFDLELSEPVNWLELDLFSGEIAGGDSLLIQLTFDTNAIIAGDYECDIIISDDREETLVPVLLSVIGTETEEFLKAEKNGLIGIYPNPFNPTTQIKFSLQKDADITLQVFNVKGQLVKTLFNGKKTAGFYSIVWDGNSNNGESLSSGIYFSMLKIDNEIFNTKKMIMLK